MTLAEIEPKPERPRIGLAELGQLRLNNVQHAGRCRWCGVPECPTFVQARDRLVELGVEGSPRA
jgi:hypothetical protein